MSLYGSNKSKLDFGKLTNQLYPLILGIILYLNKPEANVRIYYDISPRGLFFPWKVF